MLTEIKRPEVGPNADALTSLTRGRGPRRGNLEELLKYWRPIMKKPGGFRRCVVILMDKPQFGGKPQRICAWLHHELTGKWPNEGNHHGRGGKRRRRRRSVRRSVRGAARRAKSDMLTPQTFDISPLRVAIRESREFGGILVQPIAGRQNVVELKAALFSTYSDRVVVSSEISEKRVGVVGSSTAVGQAAQAAGSIILPGDISDIRSPIRSQIYETLTPGGGRGLPSARRLVRGARRGGEGARNKFRCPPGFQKGGTFTNAQFSTCGAQILGIPGKGVGSPSSGAQRALAALARDASLVREIGDLRSNRNPYDIIRAAQIPVAPKKGSPTRRQTSINNVLSRAEEADFSIRAVRRDGVILEPVVSLQALGKLDEFDDLADGTLIDTYVNGQIGRDIVPAFSTGLRDVYVDIPGSGSVRMTRVGGELSASEIDNLRRVFPTSIRRAADLPDPSAGIRDFADRSNGRFTVEFGELKNNQFDVSNSKNELIRVQTAGGKTLTVPQWVYETFLSRSAPRRAKDAPVYEIVSEKKSDNPFLISTKSQIYALPDINTKQDEIDARASMFTQMLEDTDFNVKARASRGARRAARGGRTRAIFDANLNRYRCPPGTRYGGRISDKFGRNCGYSLPRQIVNELVDFGVRIEERLDNRKRRRRGVDTQPGDRGGIGPDVRADLDDIFQRLDNIEKELGIAFDKVEDRRPGRVGATIGERRARQDLTDREKDLLEGNELAEAIEDLGRIIDNPDFDNASDEELREAFNRVQKAANLEAGRLTETPPRSPEQRSMSQRILDAIARVLRRLADRLDGGRGRDRDRDRDRGRDRGGRGAGAPDAPNARRAPQPRRRRDRDADKPSLENILDELQDRARNYDAQSGGMTGDFIDDLNDSELDNFIRGLEDNLEDLGDEGRDMLGRLRGERDRRRRDDNGVLAMLNDMQDQQRAFDKIPGGKTGMWVDQLNDGDLDRYIDALQRADADFIGKEGAQMLRNLIAERDRRNRPPKSGDDVLREIRRRGKAFDVVSGGMTADFVADLDDSELNRFIDGLRRHELGDEGREMLERLEAEKLLREGPPRPHRRRIENINIGRRAAGGRNRRRDIAAFEELTPDNRRNLRHQAGVEFDELAEEWRVALGADDINGFSENDMRNFVARKVKNNDEDARVWRRRYNDYLELNELNRKLEAAENDDDVDNALREHVGRLAANRRDSIVNARDVNAADRPNRNSGSERRGDPEPPPGDLEGLIREINEVDRAGNIQYYNDAELNDRIDILDAEYNRYGARGDLDGPPPRRLAEARDKMRRERDRRNAGAPDGDNNIPEPPEDRTPPGDIEQRVGNVLQMRAADFDNMGIDEIAALQRSIGRDINRRRNEGVDVPESFERADRRLRDQIDRLGRIQQFQVDRPYNDRDISAIRRQILDLESRPDEVGGAEEIARLRAEIGRRQEINDRLDVASGAVPSANPSAIRSIFDLASNRRRRIRRRQDKMDELAEKFWGDERPFDLGRTRREAREKWAAMPLEERDEYMRKMYLHGKEVDLDTFEHKGKVYRKSFEMNVNSISYRGDGLPGGVSGQAILRIRDEDGNIVKEATYNGYPDGGFSRSFSGTTVNHDSFGIRGTGMHFIDADGERVDVNFNTGGGGAEQFNSNAFAFYKGLGYSKVRVGSAAGDGKAAWAVGGFRAPDAEIRRLNEPNGSIANLMADYDAYKSAVAAGNLPNAQQIHARMVVGDDTRRERLQTLFDAARNAQSPSGMPDHADYAEALKPSSGRNTAFYNYLRPSSPVGRGMDANDRDDLIRDINREIGTDAVNTEWFETNEFDIRPQISGGTLSLSKLKLPSNRRRRDDGGADASTPDVPTPDTTSPDSRPTFQNPIGTPISAGLGSSDRPGVPQNVGVGNVGFVNGREIAMVDQTKANEFVAEGGRLADVPDDFLLQAIKDNSGSGRRFVSLSSDAAGQGSVNDTGFLRDTDTGAIIGYKYGTGWSYFKNEGPNEVWGAEVAQRFGFHQGTFRYAGPKGTQEDKDNLPAGARARANYAAQPIVFEAHQNFFGADIAEAENARGAANEFARANPQDKVRFLLLDAVILQPDRHGQNWMVAGDRGDRQILPIDHGGHMEPDGLAFRLRPPELAFAMDDTDENAVEAIRNYLRGDWPRNGDYRRINNIDQATVAELIRGWQESARAREDAAEDLRETIAEIHNRAPGGVYDREEIDGYMDRLVTRYNVLLNGDPEVIAGWFFEFPQGNAKQVV